MLRLIEQKGRKRKGEKNNQSRGQKTFLSARSQDLSNLTDGWSDYRISKKTCRGNTFLISGLSP